MRAECVGGHRPCPFVGCRHHLGIEVTFAGSLKLNSPDLDPTELPVSCSLDVADGGGHSLDEVAQAMNITHERVRQIEIAALEKLKPLFKRDDFL